MSQMTITEALAEIKLIEKKIDSKTQFVVSNLTRVKHLPDPLKDGPEVIRAEIQGIGDLRQRIINIRAGIAKANVGNNIVINGVSRTIQEWLTWKREISKHEIDFSTKIHTTVAQALTSNSTRPQLYKKEDNDQPKLVELETNVHYPDFVKKAQDSQEVLDKLDGQLSLKNATIVITI